MITLRVSPPRTTPPSRTCEAKSGIEDFRAMYHRLDLLSRPLIVIVAPLFGYLGNELRRL